LSKLIAKINHKMLFTRIDNIFITYILIVFIYVIFCNLAKKTEDEIISFRSWEF
jgi:hypothetical protein